MPFKNVFSMDGILFDTVVFYTHTGQLQHTYGMFFIILNQLINNKPHEKNFRKGKSR